MQWEELRARSPEERAALTASQQADLQERSRRYHRVFAQSDDGQKIFEEWIQSFCFGVSLPDDATVNELAKAEARREFVGMIMHHISSVDANNE